MLQQDTANIEVRIKEIVIEDPTLKYNNYFVHESYFNEKLASITIQANSDGSPVGVLPHELEKVIDVLNTLYSDHEQLSAEVYVDQGVYKYIVDEYGFEAKIVAKAKISLGDSSLEDLANFRDVGQSNIHKQILSDYIDVNGTEEISSISYHVGLQKGKKEGFDYGYHVGVGVGVILGIASILIVKHIRTLIRRNK